MVTTGVLVFLMEFSAPCEDWKRKKNLRSDAKHRGASSLPGKSLAFFVACAPHEFTRRCKDASFAHHSVSLRHALAGKARSDLHKYSLAVSRHYGHFRRQFVPAIECAR